MAGELWGMRRGEGEGCGSLVVRPGQEQGWEQDLGPWGWLWGRSDGKGQGLRLWGISRGEGSGAEPWYVGEQGSHWSSK